jgi:bifunctional isochorismate lyase/aryl carrier protein
MTALTLERMRADIARMLHESPEDILDEDNLMDLGLDSMRLMKLASQWREAGARVEFADLAAEATLSQWWSLVQGGTAGAGARNDA